MRMMAEIRTPKPAPNIKTQPSIKPEPIVEPGSKVDGRVLRGRRTRDRIVIGLLDLVSGGLDTPTAQQIADAAGVSVRSVFQHFTDLEELYECLVDAQTDRFTPLFEDLDPSGSLEDRIAAIALQRRNLYEAIRPIRHAVATRMTSSPVLSRRVADVGAALRTQVLAHFAPELTRGAPGRWLGEALDSIWSFENWDGLRSRQDLSPEQSCEVLIQMTRSILLEPAGVSE